MTKRPFDKIADGLQDAIAYSKGDTSKGRAHNVPINEADRQARAAFKALFDGFPRTVETSLLLELDLSYRTFLRMLNGERDIPPGLALTVANWLEGEHGSEVEAVSADARARRPEQIAALKAWAADRGVRSTRKLFPSLKEWEDQCKAALARGDWQKPDA